MGVPLERIKVGLKVRWCTKDGRSYVGVLERIEDVPLGGLCHFLWDCYNEKGVLTNQVDVSYYIETVNLHEDIKPITTAKTFEDLL
jgi:hypothetical protein